MSADETRKVKMRFKCTPEGKLLKGAPGNYTCGEVYMMPYRLSRFKFWELIEKPPELHVPPMSGEDSVFSDEESVFVPPEVEEWGSSYDDDSNYMKMDWGISQSNDGSYVITKKPEEILEVEEEAQEEPREEAVVELNPSLGDSDANIDPNTPATVEPYASYNPMTGRMGDHIPVEQRQEDPPEELTREEIYKLLEDAGISYSKYHSTKHLLDLVEPLNASIEE